MPLNKNNEYPKEYETTSVRADDEDLINVRSNNKVDETDLFAKEKLYHISLASQITTLDQKWNLWSLGGAGTFMGIETFEDKVLLEYTSTPPFLNIPSWIFSCTADAVFSVSVSGWVGCLVMVLVSLSDI